MKKPTHAGDAPQPALLPSRTVLIGMTAVVLGGVVGLLSFAGGVSEPLSVVAGLGAAGTVFVALHHLME
ncbi:hypothetical protein HS041_30560 [Planomonospora sp. ID67723]|uniref:hypothetical protein n=1 Tax=Planomonospora sp. ID67723 TaxID=2738134 RepID=UPI0018C3CEE1|nr:hypothetical protein [Planomonospora sp. ID67723]MBG0832050.1 hypothetical protein [Planomonospora sp. ID67723]